MLGMLLTGCSKDDDNETPGLPPLPDPDDVCSCMDDVVFMKYCYENFDANKDGKVARNEANAVTKIDLTDADVKTLTGIGYFPNLEIIICKDCSRLATADLGHNLKITILNRDSFYGCSSLTSIILPASLKKIAPYAFHLCRNLTIYCKATTPPTSSGGIFTNATISKIYVPMKSVDVYKADENWKWFEFEIVGYDF